jgi:hypothetical protein
MPIEPIDLQVLFSRMLDIGKEEAVRNETVNVTQSVQAGELVRKTEERSNSVNQAQETDEVRHLEEQESSPHGSGRTEHDRHEKDRRKRGQKESFQDPELGKNIDITG